jgi:hypothetical protein
MSTSYSRQIRRAEKKMAEMKKSNGNGHPIPSLPSAEDGLLLKRLVEVFDKNSEIFGTSISAIDTIVQSLSRVMDDLVCGREINKHMVNGVEHVDFNRYMSEYQASRVDISEALKEEMAKADVTVDGDKP